MNINIQGDYIMRIKKYLIIFITILLVLNINCISFAIEEDDPDYWDYVWLDEAIEESKQMTEPIVLSRYAIVYDRASKTTIWGKNENTRVPMASTTKIMTAIVMIEQLGEQRLNETVIVSKEAAETTGSRLGLRAGDELTYNDLLYGLMLCSGNDAAVEIAISSVGSVENFARLMNKKAKELGLVDTHFVTPHGLDKDGHYTTAIDLAKITDYALNIPKIAQVASTAQYPVRINGEAKIITNTNELLGYLDGVTGVKTGYTSKAGRCLVTSVSRNGFDIIVITLGADTKKIRTQDSIKLIEYTYREYELRDLTDLIETEYKNWVKINKKRLTISKGVKRKPEIYLENNKTSIYPVKKNSNINVESTSNTKLEAPVVAGTEVGKITLKNGNAIIQELPIRTKYTISKKGIYNYLGEFLIFMRLAF